MQQLGQCGTKSLVLSRTWTASTTDNFQERGAKSLGNLLARGPELTERQLLLNRVGSERVSLVLRLEADGGKTMQDTEPTKPHIDPEKLPVLKTDTLSLFSMNTIRVL